VITKIKKKGRSTAWTACCFVQSDADPTENWSADSTEKLDI
jgi:hypothetical protein